MTRPIIEDTRTDASPESVLGEELLRRPAAASLPAGHG